MRHTCDLELERADPTEPLDPSFDIERRRAEAGFAVDRRSALSRGEPMVQPLP